MRKAVVSLMSCYPLLFPGDCGPRRSLPGAFRCLMGVVNVTPDSFSDGGRFFEPAAAVEHGLRLAAEGADLLDVGGQSTRPGAVPVAAEEELRRVLPVIAALRKQTDVPISIDTFSAQVAAECLAAGAEVINDITALTADRRYRGPGGRERLRRLRHAHARHAADDADQSALRRRGRRGVRLAGRPPRCPRWPPGSPRTASPWTRASVSARPAAHNLAILNHLSRFRALGCPLLIGLSRKAFIGQVIGDPAADRTAGTIGAALAAARQGVEILRVHDVAAVRQALLLFEAVGGLTAE